MKKILSISFTLLILLSGMHLSINTHVCGKVVTAVKWSFTVSKATCGMESGNESCPANNGIDFQANCCHDITSVFKVDENYNPSTNHFKEVSPKLIHLFFTPFVTSFQALFSLRIFHIHFFSTNIGLINEVSLPEICIFRI